MKHIHLFVAVFAACLMALACSNGGNISQEPDTNPIAKNVGETEFYVSDMVLNSKESESLIPHLATFAFIIEGSDVSGVSVHYEGPLRAAMPSRVSSFDICVTFDPPVPFESLKDDVKMKGLDASISWSGLIAGVSRKGAIEKKVSLSGSMNGEGYTLTEEEEGSSPIHLRMKGLVNSIEEAGFDKDAPYIAETVLDKYTLSVYNDMTISLSCVVYRGFVNTLPDEEVVIEPGYTAVIDSGYDGAYDSSLPNSISFTADGHQGVTIPFAGYRLEGIETEISATYSISPIAGEIAVSGDYTVRYSVGEGLFEEK